MNRIPMLPYFASRVLPNQMHEVVGTLQQFSCILALKLSVRATANILLKKRGSAIILFLVYLIYRLHV